MSTYRLQEIRDPRSRFERAADSLAEAEATEEQRQQILARRQEEEAAEAQRASASALVSLALLIDEGMAAHANALTSTNITS
jgi:hypothetical protein